MTSPNSSRAPTWARSVQPCQPKAAWRTSSTVWCSGLKLPSTCAHWGRPVEREERPGDEERRRDDRARDVVEVVDRLQQPGDHDPERRPAEPADERDRRHDEHVDARVQAEAIATSSGTQPYVPGADRDPQRLAGDDLLGVDRARRGSRRRCAGRSTSRTSRTSTGRPRRTAPPSRRCRCRRSRCSVARDLRDERAEAEAEREQVDRRLDGRRERRRAPERAEVRHLAHEDAADRRAVQRVPRARVRRGTSCDLLAGQQHEDVLEVGGPALAVGQRRRRGARRRGARRSFRCAACAARRPAASRSTSASRAGGP